MCVCVCVLRREKSIKNYVINSMLEKRQEGAPFLDIQWWKHHGQNDLVLTVLFRACLRCWDYLKFTGVVPWAWLLQLPPASTLHITVSMEEGFQSSEDKRNAFGYRKSTSYYGQQKGNQKGSLAHPITVNHWRYFWILDHIGLFCL